MYMYIYISMYIHIYVCISTYIRIYIYMYVYLCIYIYMCVCVYIYDYMKTFIYYQKICEKLKFHVKFIFQVASSSPYLFFFYYFFLLYKICNASILMDSFHREPKLARCLRKSCSYHIYEYKPPRN